MLARAIADEGGLELLQQHALLGGQVDRGLHHHAAVEVAGGAAAHRLDAAVAQAELLAALRLGGNAQLHLAPERGHAHDIPEGGLRNADRHFAMEVVAVAFEDVVRTHAHLDVEVPGRRTGRARLALARQADAVAVVDARGDLDLQRLGPLDPPLPVAVATRRGDGLAATGAVRAGLLHREDAALE